jgi:hypothetical protein
MFQNVPTDSARRHGMARTGKVVSTADGTNNKVSYVVHVANLEIHWRLRMAA